MFKPDCINLSEENETIGKANLYHICQLKGTCNPQFYCLELQAEGTLRCIVSAQIMDPPSTLRCTSLMTAVSRHITTSARKCQLRLTTVATLTDTTALREQSMEMKTT